MIRLGIIGCSEIAFRRFMPAVKVLPDIIVVAVAEEYDVKKLKPFCIEYGLEGIESYKKLIHRDDIDAVYIPQPPALHYKWAKEALESDKHVLIEKPSTTNYLNSKELVELAVNHDVALHENYMFQYHNQISEIKKIIDSGTIGDIRLIRANFGFPLRAKNDFRYVGKLGGGALMDAAGYPVKIASLLLGDTIKVDTASMNTVSGFEVDMYGSCSLSNDAGVVCQIGYGMDCSYQCNLEVWGSIGHLFVDRVFTAPADFKPIIEIQVAGNKKQIELSNDSHFTHSIESFINEINMKEKREQMYKSILLQSKLIDSIREKSR